MPNPVPEAAVPGRAGPMGTCVRMVVGGLLGIVLAGSALPAHGQADTTDTAGADTTAAAPADTTERPRPDTAQSAASDSLREQEAEPALSLDALQSVSDPGTGRPALDSLPTLTPHVSVERVLAQVPGSFLYDLGAAGWPHGWSPRGLGPHRSGLWVDGLPYQDPLTGRARFDLLPPSFLAQPRIGTDPGGAAVGVHAAWREYDQIRPLTELRYRVDSNGLNAIEVGHSQKHRLSLFGAPGLLQASFGFGGRATDGAYNGSDLRAERRIWGRLRYQRADWAVELTDLSSRHRIGAHSGVTPESGEPFPSIYVLPRSADRSQKAEARRRTFRNDLTARVRGPMLPGLDAPTELAATWTRKTFDFETDPMTADTTWSTKLDGGHGRLRQPLRVGRHNLTLGLRGSIWGVNRSNVPQIEGTRWSAHAFARDSLALGATRLVLTAGGHATPDQQYPSAAAHVARPLGPVGVTAAVEATGQRLSWFGADGFSSFVRPLPDGPESLFGRVLRGRAGVEYTRGALDLEVEAFAHQIRNAVDLYANAPAGSLRVAASDTVAARRTATPVRRLGATASAGWRTDVSRGLYLEGRGTTLTTLNAGASGLHTRLARTLPRIFAEGRVGVRFVFFVDLITDLYVQARGWTAMGSRWFHPPTGRLAVPPASDPVPSRRGTTFGPSGTIDVHAEIKLRGATLFFSLENVQNSFAPTGASATGWEAVQRQATVEPGTFVVPVYPLPARQFRFGVHWPIFD